MPIISTLSELFQSGAVAVAEQFIFGVSKLQSIGSLLGRFFGSNYNVPEETAEQFADMVSQAIDLHNQTLKFDKVLQGVAEIWPDSGVPGQYIQRGLAKISVSVDPSEPLYTTHLPFEFHNLEVINYETILDRIKTAVDSGSTGNDEYYAPDISRIEQAINYHNILGANTTVETELYSLFRGG